MQKLVVASAQQQMRLFDSLESYRKELGRFLHMASAKGAQVVVFPELAGVMAATPMVEGFRVKLFKQAHDRHSRQGSLWARTRSALASGTASLLKTDFRKAFIAYLHANPPGIASVYEATFGELAEAYQVTIVAGSAYLPDAAGIVRHCTAVFGPDGAMLGRATKVVLSPAEEGMAVAGNAWTVVATPVGRLGILFGEEALYPEAGRLLAYQGTDLLVTLGAVADQAAAAYVRQGAIARAQDNLCFALTSFLVGKDYLAPGGDEAAFVGKSGIYAPLEMTPRHTGILVEMGTDSSEGLLTAELDREQLRALWKSSRVALRREMPADLFAEALPALYSSRRTLADAWQDAEPMPEPAAGALPAPPREAPASEMVTEQDDTAGVEEKAGVDKNE